MSERSIAWRAEREPLVRAPLPHPIDAFVGREREVAALRDLLVRPDARLLNLTGPGGVGKTRLAIAAAARAAKAFDGVGYVALATIRDVDLVLPAIAQALVPREVDPHSPADRLRTVLGDRRFLLVLDNFEQIVDAAPRVARLLTEHGGVHVLVTSRAVLHVSGERTFPVSPLALPDVSAASREAIMASPAVRLFAARAEACDPAFAMTDANAVTIAEICRRLDGLPLAIELAAARIRYLSPAALLSRLEPRLPLLEGGPRDHPARLQTMRHAIAWSDDLLNERERALFEAVSVFIGGFTLEAAEFVGGNGFALGGDACGLGGDAALRSEDGGRGNPTSSSPLRSVGPTPPKAKPSPPSAERPSPPERSASPSVLDTLASLVTKSLVRYQGEVAGESRYAMLETIREFGQERLGAGGRDAASGLEVEVRSRHADWCLDVAERAAPHVQAVDGAIWLERLELEHANLRAALSWLREQGETPPSSGGGHGGEQGGPSSRGGLGGECERLTRLAGALWPFWQEHAHYDEGRRWLETALDTGQGTPADRLRALTGAGTMAWYQSDLAQAKRWHEQALELARQTGDRKIEALSLSNLGALAVEEGDHHHAATLFAASLAISRTFGDPHPMVAALHNLAHAMWLRGEAAAAVALLEEALALTRTHGIAWLTPSILTGIGFASVDLSDYPRALAALHEGLHLGQARGNLSDLIDVTEGLARLAAATGQMAQAARFFGAAAARREAGGLAMAPIEIEQFAPSIRAARAALGEEAYAAAWAQGHALSPAEAIAEALALRLAPAAQTAAVADAAAARGLTRREVEILLLLDDGLSNREIGEALFISRTTVARHVANLYRKLGVDSRAKATAYAHRHALI